MISYRVIARLDIKGRNLIKPCQFEGLRVIGKPSDFARKYAKDGADELLFLDTVASLYGRNQLDDLIEETSGSAFIPLTVGGGIGCCDAAIHAIRIGADKVSVNTAALNNPSIINEISDNLGSQALCVSIEAKRVNRGWEAYTDGGRNPTGRDAIQWAHEAVDRGAGEILLTSIDRDGTRKGPDIELLKALDVSVPVVYSGGIRPQDVLEVAHYSQGMAIGASLHYGDCTIAQVKEALLQGGKEVRHLT